MKPVAVLGAGIAGLTAAVELKRRDVPVIVFEAGKTIAGLASSWKDSEGYSYDFGAHFVTGLQPRSAQRHAAGPCATTEKPSSHAAGCISILSG